MTIRTVITEQSVWEFNLDDQTYRRAPRIAVDLFDAPVPYTPTDWEPYLAFVEPGIHPYGDSRLLVVRPVPMGEGRMRLTGHILSDEVTA